MSIAGFEAIHDVFKKCMLLVKAVRWLIGNTLVFSQRGTSHLALLSTEKALLYLFWLTFSGLLDMSVEVAGGIGRIPATRTGISLCHEIGIYNCVTSFKCFVSALQVYTYKRALFLKQAQHKCDGIH